MMLLGVCGLPCLLRCQADHYPRQVRDRRDWLPLLCPCLGSGEQGLEESWSQYSPLIGAGCVPGDWSAGLRGGGDCGPADAPDRGLAVPGPVPGAGGDAACLLRLHWAGAVWLHPLLLGPGSWHGQGVQDEARGGPGPSYQGTPGRWLKFFRKLFNG